MREIKFRGISTGPFDKGQWRYGYLVDLCGHPHIGEWRYIGGDASVKDELFSSYYGVRPETIGEYTGLKDTNGTEIYEGDILGVRDPYNMSWADGGAPVVFSHEYVGGWVIMSSAGTRLNIGTRTEHVRVIGNIHENPELLQ